MMLKRLIDTHSFRAGAAALAAMASLSLQTAVAQTAPATNALPTDAQVVAGSAHVVTGGTAAAPVMTVNQGSDRAIVNWNTFNVGRDASVVFQQPAPSSVILNRVLDSNPSAVFGNLQANGQVFLLNPAGVWFGAGASVDAGALVATTHSMSNADFMAGNYRFERNGASGKVINEGSIEARLGGYIALLAPEVRNDGVLLAKSGTIALAAGETVTLNVNPATSKVDLLVTPSTVDALIENKKIVKAPDGNVIVSAQAYNTLASGVIKNSGEINAAGITRAGGKIVLGASTEVANTGTLDASSAVAAGGSVSIEADTLTHSGLINVASTATNMATGAAAAEGKGGEAILSGNYIYIEGSAKIDATGTAGGGKVLVGGDWQGGGDLRQAITVSLAETASVDASAISTGNGGTIVFWSDVNNTKSITRVNGSLFAHAGEHGGNGGQIETSGHALQLDGIRINTESLRGEAGLWLIDPYDISIGTSSSGTGFSASGTDYLYTSGTGSYITASAIVSALGSSNVTIQTGSGGTGFGDILLNSALSYGGASERSLTLRASRNVFLNEAITSTGGRLNLTIVSDHDLNSTGDQVRLGTNVTTNGGSLTLTGENIVFQGTSGQTINTARSGETGGALTVNGTTFVAVTDNSNASTLNIATGGGNVTFNGTVESGTDVLFQRIFDVSSDSNFDSLAATYGFGQISGASSNSFYEFQRTFGLFSNQTIELGFTNLNNSKVGLNFNFFAIDSWDGASGEFFNVKISSDNGASYTDLFTLRPNWSVAFSPVSGTNNGYAYSATVKQEGNLVGSNRGNFDQMDRRIAIAITTPSVSGIRLRMQGALDGDVVDESWAVNNFTLTNSKSTFSGPGSLSINAGAGTVTLGNSIGAATTLKDLSITAGNMVVNQTSSVNVSGDMLINSGITKNAGADSTLTFKAARHLSFGANTNVSSTNNKFNLVFNADTDKSGDGFIKFSGNISSTNGGSVKFGVGDTATLNGSTVYVGGDVNFDGSSAQTIATNGGAITVFGETLVANTTGLTMNSSGGTIDFKGSVNSANQYAGVYSAGGLTWLQADAAAVAAGGYLATITSRLENSLAALAGGYNTAWIGGRRLSNGTWRWERGPEAGQTFSYTNWAGGEPNNCCTNQTNGLGYGGENATQFTGSNGNWNDLFDNSSTLNNYVRETTISAAPLTVNAGTGSVLFRSTVGNSKEISALSITAGSLTASSLKTTSGVRITNTTDFSTGAVISGTGGLTKAGLGTLTLTGTSTYTGATNVNAGTLKIAGSGIIYCDSTCGSDPQFGDSATAITTVNSGAVLDITNWNWGGNFGERHYQASAIVINGGTLRYSGTSGTPASGGRGLTVGALGATFESATSGVTWSIDDGSNNYTPYKSVFNGNVTLAGVGNIAFGHSITGSGSLTKSGAGTATLTGTNTYTGTTTINAGTLQIGTGGSTGTLGTGNVTNNGSLVFDRAGTMLVPNLISGNGSVTKRGTGNVSLMAANTYSGGTTLSTGTLGVYQNTAMGSGTVTGAGGASLLFGRGVSTVANNFTLNGNVTFDFDNYVDYLIIGGGGGGSGGIGGGGGAGEFITGGTQLTSTSYGVTVGNGGAGGVWATGTSGGASAAFGISAAGGGAGGSGWGNAGLNGGSGGGGGGAMTNGFGTSVKTGGGFGFNGGNGSLDGSGGSLAVAGGGGGAGGAGGASSGQMGGNGGAGRASDITGTSVMYAGGGGGGVNGQAGFSTGPAGTGQAGGGNGGPIETSGVRGDGGNAAANSGSGGGGASNWINGGTGGSGIVIVRYLGGAASSGGSVAAVA